MQYDMQAKEKEDRQSLENERTLSQLTVRSAPFGSDRRRREYWSFRGDDRLFVQQRRELPVCQQQQGLLNGLLPRQKLLTSASACLQNGHRKELRDVPFEPEIEEPLWRLFELRPSRFSYQWSVYTSNGKELWYLWDALDDRGERELELKAALKARFDIEEPTLNYIKTGSPYIGKKVLRQFRRKARRPNSLSLSHPNPNPNCFHRLWWALW